MAETSLTGVATYVLGQLSSPACNEFFLVRNVDKDLKNLEQTIQTISDFLLDAEQMASKDLVVKEWLSGLRAVLYDADDLFDAIAARSLRKKLMSANAFKKQVLLFFSKSNQLGFVVRTAHDVKDIRARLDAISKDMIQFSFRSKRIEENQTRAPNRKETHSFVKEEDVIGREEEKEDLIELLLPKEEACQPNLSVVSIVGVGGSGKTTLAQLVYNDERVQSGFDLCLWACINCLSDLRQVVITILGSVNLSEHHGLSLDQLQYNLRETIHGKKYLLVLDDVWEEHEDTWRHLVSLLDCGKSGSKVLATTQHTRVARCLDSVQPYYELSVLSEESAWLLFVKTAFNEGELGNHPELVTIGEQIVQRTGYVPLTVVTVGRLLRHRKKEKKEWLSILDNTNKVDMLTGLHFVSKEPRQKTHSFVHSEDVIGREREREEVVKLLLPEDDMGEVTCQRNLSVISIIGFGGLGKTTLAQLVYNDERVRRGFDLCLWACVNYFSDVRLVLCEILASFQRRPSDRSLELLQIQFRETIRGKKYLLVLDDVREEDASTWGALKPLLECGESGSKVLVTTPNTRVARCLDSIQPYYQLSVLSEESAWLLFLRRAFYENELGNYPELVPIGKQIVHRTGYVPLAIITVGSMLRNRKKEKKVWLSILGNNKVMMDIQVVKRSYYDLPPALKCCFAYCSVFPRDYTFERDELVRMWLSQGFLEPPLVGMSLEEVGNEFLLNMVDIGFFQEVRGNGILGYHFEINDLLHDLAVQVAGRESGCFFEQDLLDMDKHTTLRHVFIRFDPNIFFHHFSPPSLSKTLRTLLFHNTHQFKTDFLNSFSASCKKLRTLRLSHFNLTILPNLFGDLIHLRYLDLSYNWNVEALPNSICELYHLQTLKLEGCASLKELPSKLGKLVSLRHLFLDKCNALSNLPSGLAALSSLVTLDRLIVHHCSGGLRYVGNHNSLCGALTVELPVEGWPNCITDAIESNMSRKLKLDRMNMCWMKSKADSANEMTKDEAREVLDALEPHKKLEYMNIDGYVGDALSSWVFSLSHVKEIILSNCTSEYLNDMVRSDTCQSLETLEMNSLTNLKGWWRPNDQILELPCFPSVLKVVIRDCPRLVESMPSFVGIESLRLLGVDVKLVEALLTQNACRSASTVASSSECQYNSKLKELQLCKVQGISWLASGQIKHLTALNRLSISGCNQLDWVSHNGLAHLTALETLSISDCGFVKIKDEDSENMEDDLGMPWIALQRLRDLTVPWQRHLQEGLMYLTSLERLEINYRDITQVKTDNEEVQGTGMWWKRLARLRQLKLKFSDEMISCFPRWIQYYPSLEEVEFCNCKELSFSWTTLMINPNLHKLNFTKVEKVTILVDEEVMVPRNQLSHLEELYVSMTNEEKWLHSIPWRLISSLRTLSLYDIPNLKSLPGGIQHLTSLQQLTVGNCSTKLKNRCTRNGADWLLISRIPEVDIRSSGSD